MNALATRLSARQDHAVARADAAADAVERAYRRLLRELAAILKTAKPFDSTAPNRARELMRRVPHTLAVAMLGELKMNALWGHETAARITAASVPRAHLAHAALRQTSVQEDFADDVVGVIALSLDPEDRRLRARDRASMLRNGSKQLMSADEQREFFRKLLFPAPSNTRILQLLNRRFGPSWLDQLARSTSLASPDFIASIIGNGFSLGRTAKQIEADLLPALNNVRVSARRIARTESLRIINAVGKDANDQLGDMLLGYQVHAQMDENTRPWHRARSGTIFYKSPKAGQKGYEQMPSPPEEASDASERPPGTPATAYNCRCFLTPVLKPVGSLPSSSDALGALVG